MYRLQGASEFVRESSPPVVTDFFALVTRFGDPPVVLVLVATLYWVSEDRERMATLAAYALLALAVTIALKEGLALPRPPETVQAIETDTDSFGFPSGHAIGATVVYGGLLLADERLQTRAIEVSVVALVALVGLSRVVIGVHYFGDVLVGHAIGLGILAVFWLADTDRRVRVSVAAVTTLVAGLAAVVSGGGEDALFAFGGSLAAVVLFAWVDVDTPAETRSVTETAVLVVGGLLFVGGAYGITRFVDQMLIQIAAGGLAIAAVLLFPLVVQSVPTFAPDTG